MLNDLDRQVQSGLNELKIFRMRRKLVEKR